MSKWTNPFDMEFYFKSEGWMGMTAEKTVGLIAHPPHTITRLDIHYADFGAEFV